MFDRRSTRRSFRPTMDALQERIAPVSVIHVPPLTADLSIVTTCPSTSTADSGGTTLIATSPTSASS